MDLISFILVLVVVGVFLWAINAYIPMDPKVKTILNVAVIIILLLWILSLFSGSLPNIRIGK